MQAVRDASALRVLSLLPHKEAVPETFLTVARISVPTPFPLAASYPTRFTRRLRAELFGIGMFTLRTAGVFPTVVTVPIFPVSVTVMVMVFPAPVVLMPCVPPPGVTTFRILAAGTALPASVMNVVGTVGNPLTLSMPACEITHLYV